MTEGGTNLSWFDLSEIIWINFFILKSRYRKCCVSVNFVRISHFLCVLCFFCVFFLCFEIFCVLGFFLCLCISGFVFMACDYELCGLSRKREPFFSVCKVWRESTSLVGFLA